MPAKKRVAKAKETKRTVVGDAYRLRENMNKSEMTAALEVMSDEELSAIGVAEGFGSQNLTRDALIPEIVAKWISNPTPSRAPAKTKVATPPPQSARADAQASRADSRTTVVGNAYLLRESMSRPEMEVLLQQMSREELDAVAVAEGFAIPDATKNDLVTAILNRWMASMPDRDARGGISGPVVSGRTYPAAPPDPNTPRSARVGRIFNETGH
jgi:hypothetical protein